MGDKRHDLTREGAYPGLKFAGLRTIGENALVALSYFVAGYIGSSLAVPPGYATIIWPASGLALCVLLAKGERLLPGIWLGSFSLNVMTGFDSSVNFDQSWKVLAVAGVIGIGASLQAFAGLWMARQFAGDFEISRFSRIFRALLLVVMAPCVIAPTFGVATLLVAGAIEQNMLFPNWLTWYSGDFLGVTLIMPILLLSTWSPVAVKWRGRSLQGANALVAISLIVTLLLTFYAWRFISEREYEQAEANFVTMAADTEEALRHRLQVYQRALQGGSGFAAIRGSVPPSEWREYVERMEISRAYPGMRGFGMFEAVSDENLSVFREEFASEFGNRFDVHPEVDRPEHFVINRIEPLANNLAALGLDLSFEKGRRDAIALSKVSRNPVLTRPIVLVQDASQGAGFLLILPIRDLRGNPTGRWVYAPLVAEELLTDLTPRQGREFSFAVYHGESTDPGALLYATGGGQQAAKFQLQRTIYLAGQPFTLHWASLRSFEIRSASSAPLVALASGLMITVLLGILLTIFMRRQSHIVRKVNEATAELEERNRMLEMAEATAHIGHWHLDLTDSAIRWSDEVYRLHGLEPGDTPQLEQAIEFYHPDDRELVKQSLDTAMATCQPYSFKARLLIRGGRMRHVEVRGRVDTNDEGEATNILGVIIDRTDETIMRERLTETIEEARAADKAKSSFLANMSHEIRTPMNGVIGFTELALSDEKNPEQKRRLQMIADSGNAMLRLLNDLLDFAKIEAKQMAILNEQTDLRHTLRSCQRLMEPVARERNLVLLLEVDPALPTRILVDKMRLRQIVLNLVGNALKFTEEGEVKITAYASRRTGDHGDRLYIAVRDTGIGIPEDRLESIFDKFTQADETTARRYGGTGLGLPISAELAELMGGELRAESEVGKGSVFTLSLPLEESCTAIEQTASPEPIENCGPGFRLKILVAEDNPVNQELTVAMVEKAGHDCDLASDGQEAVDAVMQASHRGRSYDMVLMDMQMPRMDGLEASRMIRAMGFDGDTLPILAVTANAYSDDIQRCEGAGMQAHLAKPLRMKDLCAAITRWSATSPIGAQSQHEAFEEETSPRLQSMFENRKIEAIEAIDEAMRQDHLTDGVKAEVGSLIHQIAGVAAYFGQQELGETCRALQREIREAQDEERVIMLLKTARERLNLDRGPR